MAAGTRVGTGFVAISPDFTGFQEKVAKRLNETLGPAMDRAGKNASKRLSKSIGNDSSLRSSFQPILKRFQKEGDNLGEQLAKRVTKGTKRAEGDMFGLADAVKEVGRQSKSTSTISRALANDTFGIARAAKDAGKAYRFGRAGIRDWGKEAHRVDSVGRRLSKGTASLARDVIDVGRNLRAAAGGFGNFEGIMARANRGFQFFRNILGSLKIPTIAAGIALLAQSLSALVAGAFAAASALGPLTGALVALPALALTAAQAVGTLKLALSGIGDAVKAATAVQIQGGEQATQTLRKQENAAEAVADAHRTLASAERDQKVAQQDLTKARKEATRQLEGMRRASEESNLTEREGADALRESRRELAKTLRSPEANSLEIRQAEQAVERAQFALGATREEAKRARADYAEAHKKGVQKMPEVVSAKRALADANRSVAAAARALTKAERDNSDAMKQQGSAATALQQKMAALTPSGRKFAKFLISLKPRYDELREVASKGFFPGAEKGIKSAMKNFGVLKGVIGETAGVFGDLAAKAGAKLGSEAWGRDLGKIGESNTRILERLGDAGLNVSDAFRNILVSAEPLIEWMSRGTLKFSEWLKTTAQTGRETGSLGHFFDETREAMERVWRILKPLGEGLLAVGHAAKPLGDEILDSLGDAAKGWAEWTKSVSGQNKLKNYFREVKPAIFAIGRLVRDLTDDFFELGRQKGVATLVETIRTKLLPLLTNGADALTGFLSGFLDKFDDLRKEGVPTFDAFVQTLAEHAAEGAIKIANALVRGFLNASILGKLAIGGWLLSKFGGGSAAIGIGKYIGRQFGVGVAETAAASTASKVEGQIAGSLGARLKSGFVSLGKQLGIAMVAVGLFGGITTAINESKGAHGIGGSLKNFSVGFFKTFGLNIGETTAEEFSKGFRGRVKTLARTGFIGKQSIITPQIESRATAQAEREIPGGEGAVGFEEAYERAISNIMRDVRSRRASAKELFGAFWKDMAPNERQFARALRRALVQGERLVKQTGITLPKVKLETNPAQTAKATKDILSKFAFLRKGIGNNLHDINKVSKEAGERIAQVFGRGTKHGRELTARNMKLTADAIAKQMARSGRVTEKGMERIKELIRNANLLAPTKKMAEEFGGEWAKGVGTTKAATSDAVEKIIAEARKMPPSMRKIALETWLEQVSQARKSGKLTADAFREMRSKVFAEFGVFRKGTKAFNKKVAEGFVGMVNSSGGAMGILMQNLSSLLGTLGDKKKLSWKIVDAKITGEAQAHHHNLGFQRGGAVPQKLANGGGLAATVPGNSTGDRHVLSIGGRPVAKVESGEGIFVGNRKMMAAAKSANDAVPRFQDGGLAKRAGGGLVEPKLEGQSGSLRRLGQAAIHKVFEGAKGYLDKHQPTGGAGGSIANAGPLQQFNHIFPSHTLAELSGKARFSESLVARIARWAGLPGRLFSQIAHGESDFYPGVYGIDPGGTIGRGLWQITSGVGNDAMIARFGGPRAMFNPLINAEVAKQIYDSAGIGAWYGTKFVTGMQDGGLLRLAAGGLLGAKPEKRDPRARQGQPFNPSIMGGVAQAGPPLGATSGFLPKTIGRIKAKARQIASSFTGYVWGGGHSEGTHVTANGLDCSGAVAKLVQESGWTNFPVAVSTEYAHRFHPGAGDLFTIWSNPDHTFAEIEGRQWGTNTSNGLGYASHTTSGFTPSHPTLATEPSAGGATGGSKKRAEKPLPSYAGLPTRSVKFGHPKTLKATEAEIRKLVGKDGKGGLKKRYRDAAHRADKDKKPATADALRECAHSIEQRVVGLRKQRNKLRLAEATKKLKRRIAGKLSTIEGYGQRVEGKQRDYEIAAQFAEQVVGLEPESPEVAPEPEVPEQAKGESDRDYEKKRIGLHNSYEQHREQAEKDYVGRYSDYIKGQESPAYQSVLERVADWRNTILQAETFGFGKGHPSVNRIGIGFERNTRKADHKIDHINTFTEKVKERVHDYREKVKREVNDWRRKHPRAKGLPGWLKDRQQNLPDWLKKQVRERENLRQQLPFLRDKDNQLREAIGTAREAFFPGGKNRLGPRGAGINSAFAKNATIPTIPLAGSGSLEDSLAEVQGIHPYPQQHSLLGAGDLGPPRKAGRFGGVIWGVQESIEGLGLKIKQAAGSIQKASLEKPGAGEGSAEEQNAEVEQRKSEREELLEELLQKANQRLAIQGALGRTLSQFETSYPVGLPFAGTFHTGGKVSVPGGGDAIAHVRDAEYVLTPEQMAALSPAAESTATGAPVIESLIIHPDGSATMRFEGREFETAVREVVRDTPRGLSTSGAGMAWRP